MKQKLLSAESSLVNMATLVSLIHQCRSQIYNLMNQGLFMRPVKLSERRVVWITEEIEIWLEAKVAGKTDAQIKTLVKELQNARSNIKNGEQK